MSKYLINNSYVVVRRGDFVEACESAAEFILDTAKNELHRSVMIEIAEANGIKINKNLKTSDYADSLEIKLYELKIPEVNKMTDTQNIEKIVLAGFAAEKTDEDMIVEIIESGVKFKEAGKLFAQVCEAKGLRKSSKNRREEVGAILDEAEFAPADSEELQKMIDYIVENVDDTTAKQAGIVIKRWAKENEIALPKRARSAGGSKSGGVAGATGFRGAMLGWLLENKDFTQDELGAQILVKKPKFGEQQVEAAAKRFTQYVEFAKLLNAPAEVVETEAAEEVEAA